MDAFVDNMATVNAWNNEACKSRDLTLLIKIFFFISLVLEMDIVIFEYEICGFKR